MEAIYHRQCAFPMECMDERAVGEERVEDRLSGNLTVDIEKCRFYLAIPIEKCNITPEISIEKCKGLCCIGK